ncbi:MAG: phage portal protein, partial [Lactobacillus sp.]|nr:phage portal protein [Lactobacillus sp.]
SELKSKLHLPNLELDVNSAIDRDGQMLINNIQKLTSGTNPVLSAQEAKNLLVKRGVISNDELE